MPRTIYIVLVELRDYPTNLLRAFPTMAQATEFVKNYEPASDGFYYPTDLDIHNVTLED